MELLNNEHIEAQQASKKVISKLKYDIVTKKEKLNRELKIVRIINDYYKELVQDNKKENREY